LASQRSTINWTSIAGGFGAADLLAGGGVCHDIWDFSARVVGRIGSQIW
jgi:hypothetical protein